MKGWTLSLLGLLLAAPARAGKLDLDIYASTPRLERPGIEGPTRPAYRWTPGDPRDAADAPGWVKHLSHAGYAGLAVAGLAGSVATGGVAPAIGFGLVALVQSYREWRQIKNESE